MLAAASVYIVCSPVDRVGKTLVARLLTEFFIGEDRAVTAFDLNRNTPRLVDYVPDWAVPATLADTRGQMALFDRLVEGDGTAKVVDLGSASFERFFTIVAQIGVMEETRRRKVQVVVLFLASPDAASVKAYAALHRSLPGLVLVPVHNEALVRGSRRDILGAGRGASLPLRLPRLAPRLQALVADPAFSFAQLRAGRIASAAETYRFELDSWIKRAVLEFRELELRLLLVNLGFSRCA